MKFDKTLHNSITISNLTWLNLIDKNRLSIFAHYMDIVSIYKKFSEESAFNVVGSTNIWFEKYNEFNNKCQDIIELLESMPDQEDEFVLNKIVKIKILMQKVKGFTCALKNTQKIYSC